MVWNEWIDSTKNKDNKYFIVILFEQILVFEIKARQYY